MSPFTRTVGLHGACLVGTLLVLAPSLGCKAPPAKRCKLAEPEPINIEQQEGEMLLPKAVKPPPPVTIQITASHIRVNGRVVLSVKNGRVDANSKRDGPDGFFIDPLFKQLKTEAKARKDVERQGGRPFFGDVTLVVHKGTPYRLLAEVLYTSNQAEFKTYTYVTTKTR